MTKKSVFSLFVLSILILVEPLFSQAVPFDSDRWDISASVSKQEVYQGEKCLLMQGGIAVLKDVDFVDGIMEFDVAFGRVRGFFGAVWRLQDRANYEEFYMRSHQSGNPDANQYTPVFNNLPGWQLYHGKGYGVPVDYPFDRWFHVKIVVSGSEGEIYINDMNQPALYIPEMKRDVTSGKIGLKVNNFGPARFANFSYQIVDRPVLKTRSETPAAGIKGTVMSWQVSGVFAESSLSGKLRLTDDDKKMTWKKLACETSGLANLARIQPAGRGSNTVYAKVVVFSETDQVKVFQFGFSDRIKIYFNGHLLYGGNNTYRSRDYRYLGTIGYFEELYLPLKKGKNELWLAVSESFGGWGIQGRFMDLSGLRFVE